MIKTKDGTFWVTGVEIEHLPVIKNEEEIEKFATESHKDFLDRHMTGSCTKKRDKRYGSWTFVNGDFDDELFSLLSKKEIIIDRDEHGVQLGIYLMNWGEVIIVYMAIDSGGYDAERRYKVYKDAQEFYSVFLSL